jgi:formate dehydrogenase (coenzyme F420) beta subunit
MIGLINIENDDVLGALRGFLSRLMESGMVDALYVPMETDGGMVSPALVHDPQLLVNANPLAPVMPINGARAVSALTGKGAPVRLGAVLRSCELRALVELVKLQQASLDGVTLINIDCPGTAEVAAYVRAQKNGGVDMPAYLKAAQTGTLPELDGLEIRQACQMCVQPVSNLADIQLHLFGADLAQGFSVQMSEETGALLGISQVEEYPEESRRQALDNLMDSRGRYREQALGEIRTQMNSNGGLGSLFAACIRCHNCMTACPICYCKTCLFRTAAFDHAPEHYFSAAKHKGAVRLLGDTMLFHMTRLNHMSASCVSCGMCTSACPSEIPVGVIFSAIGAQVQAAFEYEPGRSLEEVLPLITFQADEWTQVGEEVR